MNLRSFGTSTCVSNLSCSALWLVLKRSSNTSAIATSLIGPFCTDSAFCAAPVPRPPQPTSAICTVLSCPACTAGIVAPASAPALSATPVPFKNSRRELADCSFIEVSLVSRSFVGCFSLFPSAAGLNTQYSVLSYLFPPAYADNRVNLQQPPFYHAQPTG